MGTKKWSEIKRKSKATAADRAEARAELEAELRSANPSPHRTIEEILDNAEALADWFEKFDPAQGREGSVDELLARRQRLNARDTGEIDNGDRS
jgi:hypothetical protein